ncbi:hypothetical protein DRJ23_01415 [Candidatus Acetothermia bacterium]|nr:MAG: hypothetical protein DRJ23_01415 [Candidatus Acetothermia bacterium]
MVQTGELDTKAQVDSFLEVEDVDPGVSAHFLELSPPGRNDQRADLLRVQEGLGQELVAPLPILKKLPSILRGSGFSLTVVKDNDTILDIVPNDHSHAVYGVAIDIGTTTLACYLFDLVSGRQLAVAAGSNPQKTFGADVISRIGHVRKQKKGLEELQRLVVNALNELIARMARKVKIATSSIYKVTVVGNPTMLHLFLGLDPSGIDHSPYVPVIQDGLTTRAEEVGMAIAPFAKVEVLPGVSAYVGADIVAGMLYANLGMTDEVVLFLDVGTNGEIALAVGNEIFTCSAAAGPAFEGASISQGMSALDGAIYRVTLDGDELSCAVVGEKEARGICGSGLLDAVAVLRKIGLIDKTGRLRKTEHPLSSRIEGEGTRARFLLADGVYLTQKDIREFQLAKGAIRAGIDVLLEHAAVNFDDIDRVLVGGAFGSSLFPLSLLRTGLLPPISVEKIHFLGNSAGQGAKLVLLNHKNEEKLQQLNKRINYIELSFIKDFSQRFVSCMQFPTDEQLLTLQQRNEREG